MELLSFSFIFIVMDEPDGVTIGVELFIELLNCVHFIWCVHDQSFKVEEVECGGWEVIQRIF